MLYCQTGNHPDLVIPGKRSKIKLKLLTGPLFCVTCKQDKTHDDFDLDMIDEQTRECKACYRKALRAWSKEKPVDQHLRLTMTEEEVKAFKASKRYSHK